jgi:putative SOS response-associated peptidase YedK
MQAMCGRFLNRIPAAETARIFGTRNALPNYPARYNIAPTQAVLAVRLNPETRERSLDVLRWGLVPHWSKDLSVGAKLINARAEGIETKPSFRDAFKHRRCLIPASGFYEWKSAPSGKQAYAVVPKDEPLFAFAGLWENWRDKTAGEGAEWVRTCTIITGTPNELSAPIHDRMPVILPPAAWPTWLGEREASSGALLALLQPYPASHMRAYPIGARVGSVKNDDEALLEPAGSA